MLIPSSGTKFRAVVAMLAIAICSGYGSRISAADKKADPKAEQKFDLHALTQELSRTKKVGDSVLLVFWFPQEFFKASVQDSARLTDDQKAQYAQALSPYTTIAVIDAKEGGFGTLTYKSEAEVRDEIRFFDSQGKAHEPLVEDDISGEARVILGAFKPIMTNMMGPMGKNLHLFFFPVKGDDGKALFDVKSKGAVTVKVGTDEFRWRLPLGSLLPPKICSKCQEKCNGAWDFCPWCGNHLETAAP